MVQVLQNSSVDNIPLSDNSQAKNHHESNENVQHDGRKPTGKSTLVLTEFGPTPWIDFGLVNVGGRYSRDLAVHNSSSVPATLTIENISHNRGLGIDGVERSALEHFHLEVSEGGSTTITLSWQPAQLGTLRESIEWKCNGTYRLYTVLSAECSGEVDRFSRAGRRRDGSGMGGVKRILSQADMVGVDETRRAKEKRRRYLDTPEYLHSTEQDEELWGAFESAQFTNWLNFYLAPTTGMPVTPNSSPKRPSEGSHTRASNGLISPPYRSSGQAAPYRALDQIHAESKQVRALQAVARTDNWYKQARSCIGTLLANATMMLRPDTASCFDVHAPVDAMYTTTHTHLTGEIVDMLCSVYTSEWLCRALQVVVGRPVLAGKCVYKQFPAILSRYLKLYVQCVFCRPHQTPCRALGKLLRVIFLLDRAGASGRRVRGQTATVFRKKGQIKSTTGILRLLANTLLYGQGDIIRQIRILGVEPTYTQTPLDEYRFLVDNTHTQLRDGVRIARLCEALFGSNDILQQCQYPADTDEEKCENVTIALQELCKHIPGLLNLPNCSVISAMDIVMGHKEKTEALVWRLMFHCNAQTDINTDDVEREINRCIVDLRLQKGTEFTPTQPAQSTDTTKELLLRWCAVVAAHFDLSVGMEANGIGCFSDGRVLCALVAYYHPHLLPYAEVSQDSKDSQGSFPSGEILHNFRLIACAISHLGGVAPVCLQGLTQNEEHMLSFVGHLCVRMMTLGRKAKAALVIQKRYRHYSLFSPSQALVRRTRRLNAVRRIESFWRGCGDTKRRIQLKALNTIVRFLSALVLRTRLRSYRQSAVDRLERQREEKRTTACERIHSWWRRCVSSGQLSRSRERRAQEVQNALYQRKKEAKMEREREREIKRRNRTKNSILGSPSGQYRETSSVSQLAANRVRFSTSEKATTHTQQTHGTTHTNTAESQHTYTHTQRRAHTQSHTRQHKDGKSNAHTGVLSYRRGPSRDETVARVQAMWRGVYYRKGMGVPHTQLLARVRASQVDATQHPSKTLKNITDRAVGHLRKGGSSEKRLANLIKACQHLEMSTALSQACRVQLAENGGLQSMVRFMKGCGRTKSQQKALLLVLILINKLAENSDAAATLMESDQDVIVTLVDVIQNFRDSDTITSQASQVLLSLASADAVYLESMRTMVPIIARAQAVYTLAMRKEAMISRARLISHEIESATSASELPGHLQTLGTWLGLFKNDSVP